MVLGLILRPHQLTPPPKSFSSSLLSHTFMFSLLSLNVGTLITQALVSYQEDNGFTHLFGELSLPPTNYPSQSPGLRQL